MSAKIEYKAKDVDAAINLACDKLNVSREELNIKIISPGSAGIFGLGRKKAVIQVSKKDSVSQSGEIDLFAEKNTKKTHQKKNNKTKLGAPLHKKKAKKIDSIMGRADEALSKSPSPETVEEIKALLKEITSLMGFPSEIETSVNGNKISAQISGEHTDALIGRDGDTLDAIQYLMRKIISQKFPEKIFFSVDSGNFRDTRKKELEELALEMASKVKETGKARTIAALNPAERRIIHVTLQDDNTIRSSSIGEGLYKKIRIFVPGKGRKKSSRRPRQSKKRA